MKKAFSHDNKLQEMIGFYIAVDGNGAGAPITRKFNSLVVWQRQISESRHELRAHFFNLR